jgi:hypothetical protein
VKYKLETIPVWDAYHEDTECPLCLLQRKAEESFVGFFLGNSVMVPEMRVQVNEVGFCPQHHAMLLEGGNRLGLALITHTHLQDLRRRLRPFEERVSGSDRGKAFARTRQGLAEFLNWQRHRCLLCDRLLERFKRYAFTIAYLWKHEAEFREAFLGARGFCLGHIPGLLAMAEEALPGAERGRFAADLWTAQARAWDRIEEELLAFTGKFDYRSSGGVGASTREAVVDAIAKLTGMPTDPPCT